MTIMEYLDGIDAQVAAVDTVVEQHGEDDALTKPLAVWVEEGRLSLHTAALMLEDLQAALYLHMAVTATVPQLTALLREACELLGSWQVMPFSYVPQPCTSMTRNFLAKQVPQ